jgi:uncharacterized membrane protein (UPF0182 family)
MRRRWALVALAVIALLLIAGRAIASLYVDHLWFDAMGASALWRTRVMYTALAIGLSAVLAGLAIFLNLYAVRRSVVSLILPRRVANIEIGEEVPGHYLMGAVIGLSVLFGVLLALPADIWSTAVLAFRGVPFRESDPYFGADLGFFIYRLPFETTLYIWSLITLLVATALVLFLYALTPSLRWERGTLHVSGYVRRHLTVLACLFLVILAWSYRLDGYQLLLEGSGADGAFSHVDRQFGLRAAPVLAFVTIGAAFVVLWTGWTGQLPLVFGAVSIVLVLSFVLKQVVPAMQGEAGTNPIVREAPYVAIRRGYTQRAFAVDEIVTADAAAGFATWVEAARAVPVWDPSVLTRAIGWAHGRSVGDATVGLQMTEAGLVETVAVPPADSGGAVNADNPWILARARAARTDGRGGAVRVDRRGIPVADDEALSRVLIHPGAGGYRLLLDTARAVPAAHLGTFASRLAHAWSLQNFRLLSGQHAAPAGAIVTRRDLRERVRILAPFFAQGSAVTPVVAGDTLYWILDLYSTSGSYPLSAPLTLAGEPRKYFQHAATAIVTAATGRVRVLQATEIDPVARTWVRLFPTLFTSAEAVSPAILEVLPPAEDGAYAQAAVFARFGTRRESSPGGRLPWQYGIDTLASGGAMRIVAPASDPAATWVQPVLDGSERVRGLVLATGGPNRLTLWLAATTSTARWTQVVERLQSPTDTAVAPRDTRWVRGAIRAFPIGGSVAFIQTTYAWRATTPPTVARVTVLAGDSTVMGTTLAHAVGVAIETDSAGPLNPVDFRSRVEMLHSAMRAALTRGDWAAFGDAFDALGAMLNAPRPLAAPPVRR